VYGIGGKNDYPCLTHKAAPVLECDGGKPGAWGGLMASHTCAAQVTRLFVQPIELVAPTGRDWTNFPAAILFSPPYTDEIGFACFERLCPDWQGGLVWHKTGLIGGGKETAGVYATFVSELATVELLQSRWYSAVLQTGDAAYFTDAVRAQKWYCYAVHCVSKNSFSKNKLKALVRQTCILLKNEGSTRNDTRILSYMEQPRMYQQLKESKVKQFTVEERKQWLEQRSAYWRTVIYWLVEYFDGRRQGIEKIPDNPPEEWLWNDFYVP
jgi:hypothetical protein